MTLRAIGNTLIIQEIKAAQKQGAILIPNDAKSGSEIKAKVISVGEGKWLENGSLGTIRVKVGETIAYNPFSGIKLKENGIEYMRITEEDIYCVVDSDEKKEIQ